MLNLSSRNCLYSAGSLILSPSMIKSLYAFTYIPLAFLNTSYTNSAPLQHALILFTFVALLITFTWHHGSNCTSVDMFPTLVFSLSPFLPILILSNLKPFFPILPTFLAKFPLLSRNMLSSIRSSVFTYCTAGAVSIATISRKRPGLKLKYLLSESG